MKKRILPLFAVFCMIFTACDKPAEEQSSSLPDEIIVSGSSETVEQAQIFPLMICGTEIKKEAKTVVSLSPAVTEIIAELGYSDRLSAISTYCDYPELSVQTAGSAENPDIAMLESLRADVLFTLTPLSERDIYALSDAGTAVVVLETPHDIEGYGKLYSDISAAFVGAEAAAENGREAVSRMGSSAEAVELESFIYVTDKLTAAGSGTFENAVLSLCGENLCKEQGYQQLLALEEAAPKYIIASDRLDMGDINSDEVLSVLVYNGAEVLFVSPAAFERPSARTEGIFASLSQQLSGESVE